ncbi:fructokinase, putative [Entamoeba invadens IP1]|uniref:fructokinase, putative n=1 Tax=Entamoeba invadens IP1 TaxID=370355 RepID=UPI0002C3E0DB|nr:fructokinase, putative [Entamoeba invadens IP1]ELP90785.1 fructokinase, putative [Entamoeba invadens IP1]|eukprot:XP_004257556.1 fructokinase, putative [Entamoeba invadens IP1]
MIAIGIGEVVWDIFDTVRKQGGAPTNFAMYMGQFGFESYGITRVGDDELGREALLRMEQFGVRCIEPFVPYETSTVEITLHNGIPQYKVKENVAWDHLVLTDKEFSLSQNAKCVCFGTIAQRSEETHQSIMKFLKAMPVDSLRVFDVNLRQKYYTAEIVKESLSLSNVVKMSDEEVQIVGSLCAISGDDLQVMKQIHSLYNMKYSLLTLGDKGSYVLYNDKCVYLEATPTQVVDTVGAGDSFTAVFVSCILKNYTVEESQRYASEVASYVCSQEGAMPMLPECFKRVFNGTK